MGLVYIARLFYIQVIDDSYKLSANNNVLRYVTEFPARGIIYDRKGRQMVTNEAAYDLMVVPRQVKGIDTLDLCNILDISKDEFLERMVKVKAYSSTSPAFSKHKLIKKRMLFCKKSFINSPDFIVRPVPFENTRTGQPPIFWVM